MAIYTKRGDKGETELIFGRKKILKSDPRISILGTIDELNSHLGLVFSLLKDKEVKKILEEIQGTLFEISSEIAGGENRNFYLKGIKIKNLERLIDRFSKNLPPLKNFIFPGGGQTAAEVHIARAVCRRLERELFSINKLNPNIGAYFNRLSDFLFVLARFINQKEGISEKIWRVFRKKSFLL